MEVATLISEKVNFRGKGVRDNESYFIMSKESIQQEYITALNLCASRNNSETYESTPT